MGKLQGICAGFLGLVATPAFADGLEIKTAPADYLYAFEANADRGYFDLMTHTIAVHNDQSETFTLTALNIDVLGDDGRIISKKVPISSIVGNTQRYAAMAAQGFDVFLNAQLMDEGGIEAFAGAGAKLATSATMAAGDLAVSQSHYFTPDFLPSAVVITVTANSESGEVVSAQQRLDVRMHESAIEYRAPLAGGWLKSGYPNLNSHHRYLPSNEFALDFFKIGPEAALDRGDDDIATDDYGHGEPIMAVADGEIVFVIDDQIQDASELKKREDETVEEAVARITRYQMQRFSEDFRAASSGNTVVIRHEENGSIEYSSYAHLAENSVTVKPGDKVKSGDVIGAVGNTGDSTLTHLHFQLNVGDDGFFSRSLPVRFHNEKPHYHGAEPGKVVTFGD